MDGWMDGGKEGDGWMMDGWMEGGGWRGMDG